MLIGWIGWEYLKLTSCIASRIHPVCLLGSFKEILHYVEFPVRILNTSEYHFLESIMVDMRSDALVLNNQIYIVIDVSGVGYLYRVFTQSGYATENCKGERKI